MNLRDKIIESGLHAYGLLTVARFTILIYT